MNKICLQHRDESIFQLENGGLKVTPARLSLLDIFKHSKKPLSVKDLSENYNKWGDVDTVTIYRNLEALEDLGVLKKIFISNKEAYYELESATRHHHHIICKQCGKISDIEGCTVKFNTNELLKSTGFSEVADHSLEFFGLCNKCSK